MLWTDAVFIKLSDLLQVDSEVSAVGAADEEPIDPYAMILQAINECGVDLTVHMQSFGGYLSPGNLSSNHLRGLFTGILGQNRTRIRLGQIVVDDPRITALKNWVVYSALVLFYRNALARTKDDRYKNKMEQYAKDIRQKYWPAVTTIGVPNVKVPLPCPGAILENSGSWGASNVSTVVVSSATGGTFYTTITYVDASAYLGPTPGYGAGRVSNGESYIAAPQSKTVATNHAISVDITSLVPSAGNTDVSQAAVNNLRPGNATGWNLYVGTSVTGPFYLQNVSPIPIATKAYSLAGDPVLSGYQPSPQYVESYLTMQHMLQRG